MFDPKFDQTRLTIMDHFMLEGVKALFKFTLAILYLAFQSSSPSSFDIYKTIRNTAKDMFDIKLLMSVMNQIKLPKDSYFAIKRSFYMVQSSFNSNQFCIQSTCDDNNNGDKNNLGKHSGTLGRDRKSFRSKRNSTTTTSLGTRVCVSANRTKVCVQMMGKLGRSHLKIMDSNVRSYERSIMSPFRNCLVIGISNCGGSIFMARQSSKRNTKVIRDQNLSLHVYEFSTEIFDGFYLEKNNLVLILTHIGEIFKIDTSNSSSQGQSNNRTENLMLRDCYSAGENHKIKLRSASMDNLTSLLWVYFECENQTSIPSTHKYYSGNTCDADREHMDSEPNDRIINRLRAESPYYNDADNDSLHQSPGQDPQARSNHRQKILIIDLITFDIFSAFTIDRSFGHVISIRSSIVSFCLLANPSSHQFSSRIVKIEPTGRYEHILSFSDVVDFWISVPEIKKREQDDLNNKNKQFANRSQRYSSIRKLITRSISLNPTNDPSQTETKESCNKANTIMREDRSTNGPLNAANKLANYYRTMMKSHSVSEEASARNLNSPVETERSDEENPKQRRGPCNPFLFPLKLMENLGRPIPCIVDYDNADSSYIPVNMVFLFGHGKIVLFEFTESYAIHTRESQIDRCDYAKVIDVTKNDCDFIITILTVLDKLIKVVI